MSSKDKKGGSQYATMVEHVVELRNRLLYSVAFFLLCFAVSYGFAEDIYNFLARPLAKIYEERGYGRLIYTSLTEAFFTYIKLSFLTAAFVSFPFAASQIYLFIAPGLYKKEKKIVLPILIFAPFLFFAGAALVYYVIFPLAWHFFLSFEVAEKSGEIPVMLEAKVGEYLSLSIRLIFAFGIAFQMPIILMILVKAKILSVELLQKNRKYWIVAIVSIAAILTPPDIISQIGLAIPMMLLYEMTILLCKKT